MHSGKPEQFLNMRAQACNAQSNPFALTPGVKAGQHAETGRIHIWNFLQVKGVYRWVSIARCRFEDIAKGIRRQGAVHIPRGQRPGESKDCAVVFAFDTFDCESRALPYLGFDCRHGISLRNCDRMMDAELACAGVLGLERLRDCRLVALARLGNEPKVRLGCLPAAGIFLFSFLVRYRRHDDHIFAVLPVHRCCNLVCGGELNRIEDP